MVFVLSFSAAVSAQTKVKAENFTAVTMDGDTVELAKLKGKAVLLVLWSSRCGICHSEIPRLNELIAKYAGRKIAFLAATMENETIVEAYLRKNRFDFQILPDSFGLLLKYADRDGDRVNISFPAYFLIDRAGYVRYKDSGWDKIEPLFAAIEKTLATR